MKKNNKVLNIRLRKQIVAVTALILLFGLQSAVFAQTAQVSGLDKIANALSQLGSDLVGVITPLIAVIVICIAGYKVFSGSRDAVPWALGAVVGVIIAFNAPAIRDWIKAL